MRAILTPTIRFHSGIKSPSKSRESVSRKLKYVVTQFKNVTSAMHCGLRRRLRKSKEPLSTNSTAPAFHNGRLVRERAARAVARQKTFQAQTNPPRRTGRLVSLASID